MRGKKGRHITVPNIVSFYSNAPTLTRYENAVPLSFGAALAFASHNTVTNTIKCSYAMKCAPRVLFAAALAKQGPCQTGLPQTGASFCCKEGGEVSSYSPSCSAPGPVPSTSPPPPPSPDPGLSPGGYTDGCPGGYWGGISHDGGDAYAFAQSRRPRRKLGLQAGR